MYAKSLALPTRYASSGTPQERSPVSAASACGASPARTRHSTRCASSHLPVLGALAAPAAFADSAATAVRATIAARDFFSAVDVHAAPHAMTVASHAPIL